MGKQQCSVSAVHLLQKGYGELPEEFDQEKAIQLVKKCQTCQRQIRKHAQPYGFLMEKELFPGIQSGNGDTISLTQLLHGVLLQEVITQERQDRTQGVGAVRNQAGGKNSVGMSTGVAEHPGYADGMFHQAMPSCLNQKSIIVTKRTDAAFGMAVRALLRRDIQACHF